MSNLIEMLGAYDVIPHLNYIPQWMLHDILWARKNGNSKKTSLKERLNQFCIKFKGQMLMKRQIYTFLADFVDETKLESAFLGLNVSGRIIHKGKQLYRVIG